MKRLPPDHPIQIIRATGECLWCFPFTKMENTMRSRFFKSCKEQITDTGEEAERWRKVFDILGKHGRKDLLVMVGGDSSALRRCFNWRWFLEYQKEWKKSRLLDVKKQR